MADAVHLNEGACTDLLHGILSRDEARRLLDHASQCAQCESLLIMRVSRFESVRARGLPVRGADGVWQLPATVPEDDKPVDTDVQRAPSSWRDTWRRFFPAPAMAVAAAAVVVLVVLSLPRGPAEDTLEYWIPAGRQVVERRSIAQVDGALWDGVEAYDARDIDRAITRLRDAGVSGSYAALRDVYLANALAQDDQLTEALDVIDGMSMMSLPEPWRSEARWTHYIVLDRLGHVEEAAALLEQLSESPGDIGRLARERKNSLAPR